VPLLVLFRPAGIGVFLAAFGLGFRSVPRFRDFAGFELGVLGNRSRRCPTSCIPAVVFARIALPGHFDKGGIDYLSGTGNSAWAASCP
jgi:hypothetical protein